MKDAAVGTLVSLSVLAAFLSGLGILTARAAFDRLHYVSAAAIAVPIPLAVAVTLQNGFTAQASIQTWLVAAIVIATNPVATHALARAFRIRHGGDLRAHAGDEPMS